MKLTKAWISTWPGAARMATISMRFDKEDWDKTENVLKDCPFHVQIHEFPDKQTKEIIEKHVMISFFDTDTLVILRNAITKFLKEQNL